MRGQGRVGLGACKFGEYPWDKWAARASAAGVERVELGREIVREAYQHGWSDKHCVLAGWRFDVASKLWGVDGEALIELAKRRPAEAAAVWQYLLDTDGERGQQIDGRWVEAAERTLPRPRAAWMVVLGAMKKLLAELKRQEAALLSIPEANDVVYFWIGDGGERQVGHVSIASGDTRTLVITYGGDRKTPRQDLTIERETHDEPYREREGERRVVRVEVIP